MHCSNLVLRKTKQNLIAYSHTLSKKKKKKKKKKTKKKKKKRKKDKNKKQNKTKTNFWTANKSTFYEFNKRLYNILIIIAEKMWVAFALQKLLTFFQQKISAYLRITQCKF